jgi:hypothetical protein
LHAEIKFTTHDGCVRLTGKGVKEFEADAVDLVVDVKAGGREILAFIS